MQAEGVPPNTDIAVAEPRSASWADGVEPGLKQDRTYYAGRAGWQSTGRAVAVSRSHPAPKCLVITIGDLLDPGTKLVMDPLLPPAFEQVVFGFGKDKVPGNTIDVL